MRPVVQNLGISATTLGHEPLARPRAKAVPSVRAARERPLFLILLATVLVFQVSVLADALGLKTVGRVVNMAALLAFCVGALRALGTKHVGRPPVLFVSSVLLVLVGYSVNTLRSLTLESLGHVGALLPWVAALSVPFMRSFSLEKSWVLFYRFMLICAVFSGVEYWAVLDGRLTPTPLLTQNGDFLRGVITIFNALPDGSVDGRMYGVFTEPGTFAMFLIPAIVYALVFSKRLSLVVFLACLVLSRSIGGEVSLAVVVVLFLYWKTHRRFVGLFTLPLLVAAGYYLLSDYFASEIALRENSLTVRQDQVVGFLATFGKSLLHYPLGMQLGVGSISDTRDPLYLGSNFGPYVALVFGGIIAFVGYVALIIMCIVASIKHLVRHNPSQILACAFISLPALLLFVVQRASILDTALFAFLFAAPIIAVLGGRGAGGPARRGLAEPGEPASQG